MSDETGAFDANSACETRKTRKPIPVCSHAIVNAYQELWTSGALAVDGLAVALRRFRKSHQLIAAGPGNPSWIGSEAAGQRVLSLLRI